MATSHAWATVGSLVRPAVGGQRGDLTGQRHVGVGDCPPTAWVVSATWTRSG